MNYTPPTVRAKRWISALLVLAIVSGGILFLITNPRPVPIEGVEAVGVGKIVLYGGKCGADLQVTALRDGSELTVEARAKPMTATKDCESGFVEFEVNEAVEVVIDKTSGNRYRIFQG